MAVQVLPSPQRVFSTTAGLQPGARVYIYQSGTSTLETVYEDEPLTVAHFSPVVADAAGVLPQVFHSGTPALKAVITDSSGNTLWTIDPVPVTSTGSLASEINFTPVTGNAATDAQTAIANNTALALANKELSENAIKLPTLGGGTTAYTLSAPNAITAYATGQGFQFLVNATNTGAITLDVDSLGPKAVMRYNNAVTLTALVADDWRIGEVHEVVYDGTQFVMTDPVGAKTGGVRGIVEKATTAEAEAGTEAEVYPDVVGVKAAIDAQRPVTVAASGLLDTDNATLAWTRRNGFAAGVTDNGTGDYTVNFTTAQADANYAVAFGAVGAGGTGGRYFVTYAPTTTTIRIYVTDVNGTAADPDALSVTVSR